MVKFYFNTRIIIGFLVTLAILSWLAISSYWNTQHLVKSSSMVAHTLDVLFHTERALSLAANIEVGQRGYALTGNETFLEPYENAKDAIQYHIENLLALTGDNPVQHARISDLKMSIHSLLTFSAAAVSNRRKSFEASQDLNSSLEGKRLMDNIRRLTAEIESEENRLLDLRTRESQRWIKRVNTGFVSLLVVTGVVILSIFFTINRNLKARVDAEDKLSAAYKDIKDLYDNAPCGYHSLDASGKFLEINTTLLTWLGYEKDDVVGKMHFEDILSENDRPEYFKRFPEFKEKGAVYDVEMTLVKKDGSGLPVVLSSVALKDPAGNFIKSRSTTFDNTERKIAAERIQNLNKELEAFTYSVSHDLRAPLRSMDGYSRILQEDYAAGLDDEGKRVLSIVRNNARRMGKLIDDLLDFARLGRKDVQRSKLNMNQLVNSIANELLEQEADRKVNIKIDPLQPAYGDVDMIRQVWLNLLSNAIKYSSKTENPTIEISSVNEGEEIAYWVKDNGVGFDMQYAPKLFGVFQRLHKMQDFSGTGVGLAIVKRIIDRHHGRVWAEGQINKGATFYFTIPNSNGST
jgi:PAS domain S-box-containing protein